MGNPLERLGPGWSRCQCQAFASALHRDFSPCPLQSRKFRACLALTRSHVRESVLSANSLAKTIGSALCEPQNATLSEFRFWKDDCVVNISLSAGFSGFTPAKDGSGAVDVGPVIARSVHFAFPRPFVSVGEVV